jgi:hypothetical protein
MAHIDKVMAEKIVKKLNGSIRKGSDHDVVQVFEDGKLVASFGLRRGSSKDSGHDYIPGQIHVTKKQALDLGNCPMSRVQWVEVLKEKNKI